MPPDGFVVKPCNDLKACKTLADPDCRVRGGRLWCFRRPHANVSDKQIHAVSTRADLILPLKACIAPKVSIATRLCNP